MWIGSTSSQLPHRRPDPSVRPCVALANGNGRWISPFRCQLAADRAQVSEAFLLALDWTDSLRRDFCAMGRCLMATVPGVGQRKTTVDISGTAQV
uniref:Uncharacterized protein n=1 Tax=Arundo donax TaxID=35708 RepID=A0A0A9HBD5_ARUDO